MHVRTVCGVASSGLSLFAVLKFAVSFISVIPIRADARRAYISSCQAILVLADAVDKLMAYLFDLTTSEDCRTAVEVSYRCLKVQCSQLQRHLKSIGCVILQSF